MVWANGPVRISSGKLKLITGKWFNAVIRNPFRIESPIIRAVRTRAQPPEFGRWLGALWPRNGAKRIAPAI